MGRLDIDRMREVAERVEVLRISAAGVTSILKATRR